MTDPSTSQPPAPSPPPRGCNPIVFGVVAATLQMAVIVYFMGWC